MNTVKQLYQHIRFDENGLLLNAADWNEPMAIVIAHDVGIDKLTTDHWKIIRDLRKHYEKFGVAPTMHNICRNHRQKSDWVHSLFHNCLNAWRVAGLPDPGEEARSYLSDM